MCLPKHDWQEFILTGSMPTALRMYLWPGSVPGCDRMHHAPCPHIRTWLWSTHFPYASCCKKVEGIHSWLCKMRSIQSVVGGRHVGVCGRVTSQSSRRSVAPSATRGRKPKTDVAVDAEAAPQEEAAPQAAAEPAIAPKKRGRKPKAAVVDEAASAALPEATAAEPEAAAAEPEATAPLTAPKKVRKPRATKAAPETMEAPAAERQLGIATPWAAAASSAEQQQAELQEYEATRGADTAERRKRKKKVPAATVAIAKVTAELEEKVLVYDEQGWVGGG